MVKFFRLMKRMPQALTSPGPASLKAANDELERRVAERTAQLKIANETLVQEAQERQRLERESRESQKLLQAIIDNSTTVIYAKDLEGRYLLANRRFFELFHQSQETVIGKTDYEFFAKEDADAYRAMDQRAIAANHAITEEEVAPLDDGPHTYVSVKCPLWDETNKPYAVFGLSTDITERKHAEEAQVRLAAIVSSSDDAIVSKTLEGIITSWNPGAKRMFGHSAEEAIGKPMTILFPPERMVEEAEILTRVALGKITKLDETVRIRRDGTRMDVSVTISPIVNNVGKIIGASQIARDITERKQAEAQILQLNSELEQRVVQRTVELEDANKELEAFSYSVSHDLRAPLRGVNGFAGIVLEEYGPQLPEEGQRYLKRICESGHRMGELIDDLLAFSRLSRQPMERRKVDTVQLVHDALDELTPNFEGRQIKTSIGDLPLCEADPALLKQVWVNLLSNAIKYSQGRAPAIVEAGCLRDNGEDVYFVRDNGTGFDMQYAHKLFGVFQRLHLADEFEGTGVGLAIVQRIIHRHGGRIWAEAEENRGATFHFTLGKRKRS